MLAHQPGDSSAERETRDPGTRDDTTRRREPEGGGGTVELTDGHARLRPSRGSDRIDVDALHQREVDHQPALGDRLAGDAVTAATNRDLESFAPAEVDSVGDVCRVQTARDHRGVLVDKPVVDAPSLVVSGVAWSKDRPRAHLPEQLDGTFARHARHDASPLGALTADLSILIGTVPIGTLPEPDGTRKSFRRR